MDLQLSSFLISVAVFLQVVLIHAYNDCGATVKNCYFILQEKNKLSDLLLENINPEKMDAFCSKTTALIKCIAQNEHCLEITEDSEYQISTNGVRQFYLSMCPPGSELAEKYEKSGKCLSKIKEEIRLCDCDITLPHTLHSLYFNNELCCTLLENKYCLTNITALKCDESASNLVEKIWTKFYAHEMHQCQRQSSLECKDEGNRDTRRHTAEGKKWWIYHKKHHHHSSAPLSRAETFLVVLAYVFLTSING